MELILIFYIFLLIGFGLCIIDDFIERKCDRVSLISIFSIVYLILSIPFYCQYNNNYNIRYFIYNLIWLGLFIYALVVHDCSKAAVVLYGIIITFVLFVINIFLGKSIYNNCKKRSEIVHDDLSEFNAEL